jgi:ATP-binding cassette subfamily F protein uup
VLEDYLQSYDGCLVVVSHDRFFMDKVVDHLFVFEGQGAIRDFPGNYTQYREKKRLEDKASSKEIASEKKQVATSSSKQSDKIKLTYGERLEFEKLEKSIEKLEEKKAKLAEVLSTTNDNEELMKISAELEEIVKETDVQNERWLELAEWAD